MLKQGPCQHSIKDVALKMVLCPQCIAALAAPSQDGETPREGENWWDEAADDVMRHAKASNPPDWKIAITGGILRAFNRGRAEKDLQQR